MKLLLSVVLLTFCTLSYAEGLNLSVSNIDLKDWSMPAHEKAFHVMNVIDVLQTINGAANDPCYVENDPITSKLIGRTPSTEKVIMIGIVHAALYHYGAQMIDRSNLPKWTKHITWGVTLTLKADTLVDNHRIGVRPFGSNRYSTVNSHNCHYGY